MSQKIQSDPARLKARLNQPYTTLEEALRQIQTTIPLSPAGEKELQKCIERSKAANSLSSEPQARQHALKRRLPVREVRDAIRLIEADGWYLDRIRGSHRQYKHPSKRGLVTIAGKPGDELAPGTKSSILKQSGLK
jgi:predicted RNA binding protein YcfA (HicA-like mRNA interferase family)